MKRENHLFLLICIIFGLFLNGCSGEDGKDYPSEYPPSDAALRENIHIPQYPETLTFSDGQVVIVDYSNTSQGYIGARLLQPSDTKIKLRIWKENTEKELQYNYDLIDTNYISFPLNEGDGNYILQILQNIEGDSYARIGETLISAQLEHDKIPYLYPNQTVNYHANSSVVDLSFKLVKDDKDDLTRIYHLYEYTVDNIEYDDAKAAYVENIYVLPDLDKAIETHKGICFDYASVLAAMCRVQNIPAKVMVGYTDIEYHAWVEIYLEGEGWINPKVYFKAKYWSLVDPTFASTGADYDGRYDPVKHY